MRTFLATAITCTAVGAAAWAGVKPGPSAAVGDGVPAAVTLGVAGRTNAEPSIAARGLFVAIAWVATAGSSSDSFVAVSRDGGRTFAEPVQANDRAGTGPESVTLSSEGLRYTGEALDVKRGRRHGGNLSCNRAPPSLSSRHRQQSAHADPYPARLWGSGEQVLIDS